MGEVFPEAGYQRCTVHLYRNLFSATSRSKGKPVAEKTLAYFDFPGKHWTRIRTNNVIERLVREIRRHTCVVGCFSDGSSAHMLVCACSRHPVGLQEVHEYEASEGCR